jgi:hypothetical protein
MGQHKSVDGFDPDSALDEIRALTRGFGTRLAYLVRELDEHLAHGRGLPRAWRVPAHDYMTHSHPHTGLAHVGIAHDHEHRHAPPADAPWSRPDATILDDLRQVERDDRERTSRPHE